MSGTTNSFNNLLSDYKDIYAKTEKKNKFKAIKDKVKKEKPKK